MNSSLQSVHDRLLPLILVAGLPLTTLGQSGPYRYTPGSDPELDAASRRLEESIRQRQDLEARLKTSSSIKQACVDAVTWYRDNPDKHTTGLLTAKPAEVLDRFPKQSALKGEELVKVMSPVLKLLNSCPGYKGTVTEKANSVVAELKAKGFLDNSQAALVLASLNARLSSASDVPRKTGAELASTGKK